MAEKRKYPDPDVKILYGKAAGRCAFPQCRTVLTLPGTAASKDAQIGQIAHIVAHSVSGPRGDNSYPKEKLDTYENWILLCPTCHKIIDTRPEEYPADMIRKIKQNHEQWVDETLEAEMANISFAELDVAAKALAKGALNYSFDFKIISPEEKISKNNLTNQSRNVIAMGLIRGPEVEKYLASMALLDQDFPERLKNGFKQKYLELRQDSSGDALFMEMLHFATPSKNDFGLHAAGVAILVHLFQICDIFEK